jgi:fatty acid desaturase
VTSGRDYSIIGPERERAIARGLASAEWYRTPVPRATMRELVARTNGRAARDTLLWLGLLIASGVVVHLTWWTWWTIPALIVYGTLYGSASDSRWHECGHGTAFRAQWANSVVYYVASFMDYREPVSWRWSHARHHDDTIVVGRDLESAVPRPTSLWALAAELFGLRSWWAETKKLAANVVGRVTAEERDYVPASEHRKAIRWGRLWAAGWVAAIVASVVFRSLEPLALFCLPTLYGRWLLVVYGYTQHAGLAEDVLDHRRNTRTVLMNPVNRFLYSNMGYHIEHHMFPNVPYHALPKLHAVVAHDMPAPYRGLRAAYREILPLLARQAKDPTYFLDRPVPSGAAAPGPVTP